MVEIGILGEVGAEHQPKIVSSDDLRCEKYSENVQVSYISQTLQLTVTSTKLATKTAEVTYCFLDVATFL